MHEIMSDAHDAGVVPHATLRNFDEACLSSSHARGRGEELGKRGAIDEHVRTLLRQHGDRGPGAAEPRPVSPTPAILEHAREHRHFCKSVVRGGSGPLAIDTLREALADQMRKELAELGPPGSAGAFHREFSVQYLVGALMSVLTWWIEGGANHPAEEMERLFRRLTDGGALALATPSVKLTSQGVVLSLGA